MLKRSTTGIALLAILAVVVGFRWGRETPDSSATEGLGSKVQAAVDRRSEFTAPPGTLRRSIGAEPPAESTQLPLEREILVRTVDGRGVPIAGASLWLKTDLGVSILGETDVQGGASVRLSASPWSVLGASSAGRPTVRRTVTAELPDQVSLVFAEACGLEGRVLRNDGSPAVDFPVASLPSSLRSSLFETTLEVAVQDPEWHWTTTDGEGRFRLNGHGRGEHVLLVTGGPGWIQSQALEVLVGAREPVTLTVYPAHGVLVDLLGSDGRLALSGAVGGSGSVLTTRLVGTAGSAVLGRPVALELATGIPGGRGAPHQILRVFGMNPEAEEAPRLFLYADLPGYEPRDLDFALESTADGLTAHPVYLASQVAGFTDLRVEFPGQEGRALRTLGRSTPFGTLVLRDLQGPMFRYPVEPEADGVAWIRGVPSGTYEMVFETDRVGYRSPPRPLVLKGREARVRVELEGVARIELVPRMEDGRPYVGELGVVLGPGPLERIDGNRVHLSGSVIRFRHPPYDLPELSPGEYSFLVNLPASPASPTTLRVESGEALLVPVVIDGATPSGVAPNSSESDS